MSDTTRMTLSYIGADGNTVTTSPFTGDDLKRVADTISKGPRMKHDPDFAAAKDKAYRVTADELRQFIERYERLDAEKRDIAEQMKEVMAEAKARGYDTKVMRKVIALRKRDKDDIAEEEAVLQLYLEALGVE